jgi:beta-lactamase class A
MTERGQVWRMWCAALVLSLAAAVSEAAGDSLSDPLLGIAERSGGHMGVAAAELGGSGRSVHVNGAEAFPMQSVFKLPLAVHVLRLVDEGRLRLDRPVTITAADMVPRQAHSPIRDRWPQGVTLTVEELLAAILVQSDGTAADVLLALTGGPQAVTARLRGLGIVGIRVDRNERQLAQDLMSGAPGAMARYLADPRDTATPEGAVALLVKVAEGAGLTPASHARLLRWMTESTPGARRLKGRLPAGASVAHKTGTGPTIAGVNACTNDIGIITLPGGRRIAIAVFVKASRAPEAAREGAIADAARAVYDAWTAPNR